LNTTAPITLAKQQTIDEYLDILKQNPYNSGTTKEICHSAISTFNASEELDKSLYDLYVEKSGINPKTMNKLKNIGKKLLILNEKDRREVINGLPPSWSAIDELFGLKPQEVHTGVKRGDITKSLSVRKSREYKKKVLYPHKFALDGEKGKWGYKQEILFNIARPEEIMINPDLLNNLKDEIRQVCGKYQVKVQDATEKGMASLRKQEREEKSLFWKMILSKELDQRWFNSTKEEVRKQFNIKTLQELIESPIRTFTGFLNKSVDSKDMFWEKFGHSYIAKLQMLSEISEDTAQRYNYRKKLEQVFADPKSRNLVIWNNQTWKNSGFI